MTENGRVAELKTDMFAMASALVDANLLEYRGGNLSCRLDDDHMLITRTRTRKTGLSEDDIVTTSLRSEDANARVASSAMEIHREIYLRTDAQAVVHAHSPLAVSLSFFMDELKPVDENGTLHMGGPILVVAAPQLYAWNQIAGELAEALVDRPIVVHKWHGTFSKGEDIQDAFHKTRALEFACAQIIRVRQLSALFGDPVYPPEEIAEVIGGVPGRGLRTLR